jgi:hypothetical protein
VKDQFKNTGAKILDKNKRNTTMINTLVDFILFYLVKTSVYEVKTSVYEVKTSVYEVKTSVYEVKTSVYEVKTGKG